MLGAALGAAGAILGGIAGAQGNQGSQTQTTQLNLRDINELNKGRSALEASGTGAQEQMFSQLQALLGQGPGSTDVAAGYQAQQGLASLLQQQATTGGPSAANIAQAQQYAQNIFAPQQTAMQQAFTDQNIAANRLAAKLGRAGNDPILRNKLAQEQTRQQAMLQSQQGAFAAEQAQGFQGRQLQLTEALANVRGGLASQAFQNRQNLLQMGQSLAQAERQYRLQTAGQTSTSTSSSGGGLSGAISGALAGFGQGAGAAGALGSMFGGMSAPTAPGAQYANAGVGTQQINGPRRMTGGF